MGTSWTARQHLDAEVESLERKMRGHEHDPAWYDPRPVGLPAGLLMVLFGPGVRPTRLGLSVARLALAVAFVLAVVLAAGLLSVVAQTASPVQ